MLSVIFCYLTLRNVLFSKARLSNLVEHVDVTLFHVGFIHNIVKFYLSLTL
jgi:hypothetical protein